MQTSFNVGELSPAMAGRVDQDKYFSGTEVQFNFLPLLQGPTTRRGGTRDIGPAKSGTGGKGPLIDFVFNTEQSYVLEFGDLYVHVQIAVPNKLTTEQREKLTEFAKALGENNSPLHESFFAKAKKFFS